MRTILTRLAVFRTSAFLSAFLLAVCAACHGTGSGCH
jgi:hypothetical protein